MLVVYNEDDFFINFLSFGYKDINLIWILYLKYY